MNTCSSAGVGGGGRGDAEGPELALAQLPGHGSPPATLGALQVRSSRVLHVSLHTVTLYTCVCRYCTLCTCISNICTLYTCISAHCDTAHVCLQVLHAVHVSAP